MSVFTILNKIGDQPEARTEESILDFHSNWLDLFEQALLGTRLNLDLCSVEVNTNKRVCNGNFSYTGTHKLQWKSRVREHLCAQLEHNFGACDFGFFLDDFWFAHDKLFT
ncbi:hypothetical protein D3C71_924160 [compost metagenome]